MAFVKENFKDIYPFESNFYKHKNGFKQHYVNQGEGEPIVMVHGNPTWSFLFRDLIKDLSKDHQVIAPDHIGCGLSDKPSQSQFNYVMKNHIDNLEMLIENLNLNNITLVLHDWGGMIGMGYAGRHPEKIKRIVLLDTAAFGLPEKSPFPWAIWAFRNTKLAAWLNTRFNAFSFIASHTCSIKGMSKKIRHGYQAPYDCPSSRVATTRFVQDVPLSKNDESFNEMMKVEKGLENFTKTPTLLCFGKKDFVFNKHFYDEWLKRLPNAEGHSFHAGHYILEDVYDKVYQLIQEFFRKYP